jgi:hypothetical protein
MSLSTPPSVAATTGGASRGIGVLVRAALAAAALGLIATGLVLVSDPDDQIGAWLQIGMGAGLALTAVRPALWAGGLVAAAATAAGLVVGHISDHLGAGSSDIGPGAIALTIVLLVVTSTAAVALLRTAR